MALGEFRIKQVIELFLLNVFISFGYSPISFPGPLRFTSDFEDSFCPPDVKEKASADRSWLYFGCKSRDLFFSIFRKARKGTLCTP